MASAKFKGREARDRITRSSRSGGPDSDMRMAFLCLFPLFSAAMLIHADTITTHGIQLGPTTTYVDGSSRYIQGTATNTTNVTFSSVTIWINLYDSSGARVGDTMAMVADFEPGSMWKWKALILDDSVTSYKIMRVETDY